MEPGTFKDRLLMEQDPHQLIEGAMVAAFAIEADIAYIFLRGEYTLAAERLAHAIAEAYERQYLGKNIFGSGYSLELYLHLSGGRYICGDETGLLNALEGKRANPEVEAAFSAFGRTVRQTHGCQQRRDDLLRTAHHQPGRDLVSRFGPNERWWHEAVWRERKSETSGPLGTAHGNHRARNSRGTCRRNAGRS